MFARQRCVVAPFMEAAVFGGKRWRLCRAAAGAPGYAYA
ncbi:hypothetical protein NPIL_75881, partial [Nephila pilipes]